jgi:hypothetical protein
MTIHWIRDANVGPTKVITHCGMEGWREGADEYSMVSGSRFEAHKALRQVDCRRCLKSYERISNGPWGCTRSSAIKA